MAATLKWRPTNDGVELDVDNPSGFMSRLTNGMKWDAGARLSQNDKEFLRGLSTGVSDEKERQAIRILLEAIESCGDITVDVSF